MAWLELRIVTPRERVELLQEALLELGALSITLQDNADQPIYEPALGETPLWQSTQVTGLFDAEVDTHTVEKALSIPEDERSSWHLLEDKDWEREWMQYYQPIQCAEGFWVCPSWTPPPDPNAVNLLLDPGLAFGTGSHPTTYLCLQWLAQQPLGGLRVLDYGCGSGILGIASLLLGAKEALGVDLDPQALLASADNAQRNGLSADQFPVFLPQAAPTEPVDIIVANILAGPLVELAPILLDQLKAGGQLCLSGILADQAPQVEAAYQDSITFAPSRERDGWVCLSGHKR